MRESYLVNDLIRGLYAVAHLDRINTGTVRTASGRRFSTGTPRGYSDLSGYIRGQYSITGTAIPLYLEAKVRPNKPSAEQIKFIDQKRADGAVAGVVYSVDEAWDLIIPYIKK